MHIPHGVAVVNGKGGVCKTTLATHLAGGAGLAGWRTLFVETDPQGNARRNFGVKTDAGESLRRALVLNDPGLLVVQSVRPNVDMIAAGDILKTAWTTLLVEGIQQSDNPTIFRLGEVIAPIAEDYDLVVVDTPPSAGSFAADSAMAAVGQIVVPTLTDACSLDGFESLTSSVKRIVDVYNPGLRTLGAVMFGVEKQSTRHGHNKLEELEGMLAGSEIGVLGSIRGVSTKAKDGLRDHGTLAHEYEQKAADAEATEAPWYSKLDDKAEAVTYSKSAGGLAQDYQQVVGAILAEMLRIAEEDEVEDVIDLRDDVDAVAVAS